MNSVSFLIIVLGLILLMAAPANMGQYKKEFTEHLMGFSATMYKNILKVSERRANIVFSPFSISQALGMILAGAQGSTDFQIKRALEMTLMDDERIQNLMKKLYLNAIERPTGQELTMTNGMFSTEDININSTYIEHLLNIYRSEMLQVNFNHASEVSRRINSWVKNKTENLIQDLVQSDQIDSSTRLVLINALYFKAEWQNNFMNNGRCPFFVNSNETKYVECMNWTGEIKVLVDRNKKMHFVAFKYKSNKQKTSYLIIGYHNDGDIAKLTIKTEHILKNFNLTIINNEKWRIQRANITIPKFKFEATTNVKQILQKMGVQAIFDENLSNLHGISNEELHVSEFWHKAYIEVNENGTKAAAATSVHVSARSNMPPLVLNINKPFVFAIYNEFANMFTFIGKVGDPTSE